METIDAMARILSIEDDPDIQRLIGAALFPEGYEMHYAFNGQEGFEKVLLVDPDVILLDLMIPILSGIDLLKRLKSRKETQRIPVIILTAYGDEGGMLQKSVMALGAEDYLRKPVMIDEVIARVKQVLARSPRRAAEAAKSAALVKGAIRADPKFRTIWIQDKLVATLPRKRFQLLALLIAAEGPVAKEDLLKSLGYGPDQINALEKTLQRLREDFGSDEARRIQTAPAGIELLG